MNNTLIIYIIIINNISFLLFGIDKYKSIKNKYRIPERILLLLTILGGSFGSLLGMILFHHKTKKIKFQILIPLSLLIHLILLIIK